MLVVEPPWVLQESPTTDVMWNSARLPLPCTPLRICDTKMKLVNKSKEKPYNCSENTHAKNIGLLSDASENAIPGSR